MSSSVIRGTLPRLTNDRPPRGGHLVEPSHGGRVRRVLRDLGVLLGLREDLVDRLRERIERLGRLGLGRLDHQRLVDQQREVHRRRMEAEVEQALGDVERLDPQLALRLRP